MPDVLPVDKVGGLEDGRAGREVHGGGGVVVGGVHSGDVEVGEVVPEDGVGVGEGKGRRVRA